MITKDQVKAQLPDWFEGEIYDKGDNVTNPFTGDSCQLDAAELSMYDLVNGAEMALKMGFPDTDLYVQIINDGKAWFKIKNKDAYLKLLGDAEENLTNF